MEKKTVQVKLGTKTAYIVLLPRQRPTEGSMVDYSVVKISASPETDKNIEREIEWHPAIVYDAKEALRLFTMSCPFPNIEPQIFEVQLPVESFTLDTNISL